MTYAEGALVEPLSVAAGAIERARPGLGQPVLVCGAGPIGLATALCARAAGAHPVCVTDLEEHRLAQAASFGFDRAVKVDLAWTREQFADAVRSTMGSQSPPEIVFECTGAQSSIAGSIYVRAAHKCRLLLQTHRSCLQAVSDGGTVLQVGCGKPEIELPIMAMSFREVRCVSCALAQTRLRSVQLRSSPAGVLSRCCDCHSIVTSFRYKSTWPTVIRLLDDRVFGNASQLITHTFPLELSREAFETCVTASERSIKVHIVDEA